ncbi:uncharacterized protein MELLADRAFT_88925 [Melampsora larici-populina 98AG31]|uniref:Uncharacterized protein n=1 Tax=Melampsora larici-populina (strain 98AG31 / pathotype 3-4-7) TaxID=747676 RepID=F4R6A5_MELLP|nr:uncharacterized protein MELLADRAFT_88925 [Melampsora larici-populina 98AG31]EGG11846.1 hypothetical protein MELLADRAFT_88925 [Melampsora larici-populina 98AG31]
MLQLYLRLLICGQKMKAFCIMIPCGLQILCGLVDLSHSHPTPATQDSLVESLARNMNSDDWCSEAKAVISDVDSGDKSDNSPQSLRSTDPFGNRGNQAQYSKPTGKTQKVTETEQPTPEVQLSQIDQEGNKFLGNLQTFFSTWARKLWGKVKQFFSRLKFSKSENKDTFNPNRPTEELLQPKFVVEAMPSPPTVKSEGKKPQVKMEEARRQPLHQEFDKVTPSKDKAEDSEELAHRVKSTAVIEKPDHIHRPYTANPEITAGQSLQTKPILGGIYCQTTRNPSGYVKEKPEKGVSKNTPMSNNKSHQNSLTAQTTASFIPGVKPEVMKSTKNIDTLLEDYEAHNKGINDLVFDNAHTEGTLAQSTKNQGKKQNTIDYQTYLENELKKSFSPGKIQMIVQVKPPTTRTELKKACQINPDTYYHEDGSYEGMVEDITDYEPTTPKKQKMTKHVPNLKRIRAHSTSGKGWVYRKDKKPSEIHGKSEDKTLHQEVENPKPTQSKQVKEKNTDLKYTDSSFTHVERPEVSNNINNEDVSYTKEEDLMDNEFSTPRGTPVMSPKHSETNPNLIDLKTYFENDLNSKPIKNMNAPYTTGEDYTTDDEFSTPKGTPVQSPKHQGKNLMLFDDPVRNSDVGEKSISSNYEKFKSQEIAPIVLMKPPITDAQIDSTY